MKSGNKPPCEEEVEQEKLLHGQGGRWVTAQMLCAAHSELGGTRSPACGDQRAWGGWREACCALAVPSSLCPQGPGLVLVGRAQTLVLEHRTKQAAGESRGKNPLKPDEGCCAQSLFSMNQSPARPLAQPSTILLFGSPFTIYPSH